MDGDEAFSCLIILLYLHMLTKKKRHDGLSHSSFSFSFFFSFSSFLSFRSLFTRLLSNHHLSQNTQQQQHTPTLCSTSFYSHTTDHLPTLNPLPWTLKPVLRREIQTSAPSRPPTPTTPHLPYQRLYQVDHMY